MSGQNRFEVNWGEMKSKAGLMQTTAGMAIDRATNQIHYLLRTSPAERQLAAVQAEAYQAEMLKFLSQQNMQRMQGILSLSNPQAAVTEFLLERYKRNKLTLLPSHGRIGQTGLPYIVKEYESTLGRESPTTLRSLLDESKHSKNATLVTRWGVRTPHANGFSIFGQVGAPISGVQDFISLPQMAEDPSQVQNFMGLAADYAGFLQHVYVFDGGGRFVVDKVAKNSRNASRTSEYVLLGDVKGNHTKVHHWVYGFKQR